MIRVVVGCDAIDAAAELAEAEAAGAGAVATFTGLVRADASEDEGDVDVLELEHWPGATERALAAIAEAARQRWSCLHLTIVHRVGAMRPGERIVFVAAAAPHRAAALDACAYCIDRLKTDAPFWKRETRDGVARWVDARGGDEAAATRWDTGE